MIAFDWQELVTQQADGGAPYHEFLREASLSAGIYVLEAGSRDLQQPHSEDEVYVVMSGRGQIRVSAEDRPVQSGSIVFVPAGVDHRFHTITETLRVLVLFAPPEGSARSSGENQ